MSCYESANQATKQLQQVICPAMWLGSKILRPTRLLRIGSRGCDRGTYATEVASLQDGTVAGRKAVMGALQLYLDFINLFLFLRTAHHTVVKDGRSPPVILSTVRSPAG